MPTFCRHNRFIERCPICSKTLSGQPDRGRGSGGARAASDTGRLPATRAGANRGTARRPRTTNVRVYVDGRRHEPDDGYGCELVPGLRSSQGTRRLLEEIAYAAERLQTLTSSPPGAYKLALDICGQGDVEHAIWLCFLIAYLAPLDGDAPFAAILAAPSLEEISGGLEEISGRLEESSGGLEESSGGLEESSGGQEEMSHSLDERLDALSLGPRTCHQPGRGTATLRAYVAWARRAGSQQQALTGEESWSPERRFERIFERLAIPGFPRWGRYELLVTLGRLGLCEMRAGSLQLAGAASSDPVLAAAKRIFGIGDPLLLERRAGLLAEELEVPLEALDLALFNWFAPQRTTAGFPEGLRDEHAIQQGERALEL